MSPIQPILWHHHIDHLPLPGDTFDTFTYICNFPPDLNDIFPSTQARCALHGGDKIQGPLEELIPYLKATVRYYEEGDALEGKANLKARLESDGYRTLVGRRGPKQYYEDYYPAVEGVYARVRGLDHRFPRDDQTRFSLLLTHTPTENEPGEISATFASSRPRLPPIPRDRSLIDTTDISSEGPTTQITLQQVLDRLEQLQGQVRVTATVTLDISPLSSAEHEIIELTEEEVKKGWRGKDNGERDTIETDEKEKNASKGEDDDDE